MRLTLRTLLAYLDDTLDPAEARLIGQKVEESPAAQDLIDRIKKVTRRRSLANPPVLGEDSKLDPNTVAEYLSDVLSPEEIAEVEQICLEQDVYLAEVASCHQILTLMLSEPARVPPTARQRMYRLVKGRESIPYRKPPTFAAAPPLAGGDDDDANGAKAVRWPKYVGLGLLLAAGLALSLWFAWPKEQNFSQPPLVARARPEPVVTQPTAAQTKVTKTEPDKAAPKPDPAKAEPKPEPEKVPPKPEPEKAEPRKKPIDTPPVTAPNQVVKEIGRLTTTVAVLLQHEEKPKPTWKRVALEGRVSTGKKLLSLPGSRSEVKLDNELAITLWGMVPELVDLPAFESAATVHVPAAGVDVDLSLERGRVVVANPRNVPARVHCHFEKELWDITLNPQTEILFDLLRSYPGQIPFSKQPGGEPPLTELFLGVLKGKAELKVLDRDPLALAAPPGPALVMWDNRQKGLKDPKRLRELLPSWLGALPVRPQAKEAASEMRAALDEFAKRMATKDADAELVLTEMLMEPKPAVQGLAIFGLGALDSTSMVLDALDEPQKPVQRAAAILALRHWTSRNGEHDLILHEQLRDKKSYSDAQADTVMELLHSYSDGDLINPATYRSLFTYMNHDKVSIRSLAYWHIAQLDPDGIRVAQYNPDADQDVRQAAITRWRKRIPDGKLPPKPLGP